MSKSSLEYTELAGLKIALNVLMCENVVNQDEEWISVTEWMKRRIEYLSKK